MKRLERGVFRFPVPTGDRVEVTPAEIAAILEGIDLEPRTQTTAFACLAIGDACLNSRSQTISDEVIKNSLSRRPGRSVRLV